MIRTLAVVVLLVAVPLSAAPVPKPLKKMDDAKAILGKWQGQLSGNQMNGSNYVFRFGDDGTCGITSGKGPESPAEYTLDPGQSPKRMMWLNGAQKTGWRCVYALTDDTLRIGFVHPGTDIPAEFSATAGEAVQKGGVTVYELKRLRDDK